MLNRRDFSGWKPNQPILSHRIELVQLASRNDIQQDCQEFHASEQMRGIVWPAPIRDSLQFRTGQQHEGMSQNWRIDIRGRPVAHGSPINFVLCGQESMIVKHRVLG